MVIRFLDRSRERVGRAFQRNFAMSRSGNIQGFGSGYSMCFKITNYGSTWLVIDWHRRLMTAIERRGCWTIMVDWVFAGEW